MAGKMMCEQVCSSSLPGKAAGLCSLVQKLDHPVCHFAPSLCKGVNKACDAMKAISTPEKCAQVCEDGLAKACHAALPKIMDAGHLEGCSSPDCLQSVCKAISG